MATITTKFDLGDEFYYVHWPVMAPVGPCRVGLVSVYKGEHDPAKVPSNITTYYKPASTFRGSTAGVSERLAFKTHAEVMAALNDPAWVKANQPE